MNSKVSPTVTPAPAAPTSRRKPAARKPAAVVSELVQAPVADAPPAAETPAAAAAPLGKAVDERKSGEKKKAVKVKLVRDSYTIPDHEYAQLAVLKGRLLKQGAEFKKSELLRAGLLLLSTLDDAALQAAAGRVERIKTGRPAR
ncbi:hypothetical protein [Chitinilyticum litopenaei]|uniref:hypothetical protein n=1 Tax=Chitinilyticum litopenaei TaxID=1121276 RepID=UPI00040FAD1E|nr:hypothetical protein [Chitinilyticum litopenaei]